MKPIRLPDIPCPLPLSKYPFDVTRVEENTIKWMDHWQLYSDAAHRERLICIEGGRFAALLYPEAKSNELLQLACDFLMWGFSFDDEYCDEGGMSQSPTASALAMQRMQRCMESPEVPLEPQMPYAMALRDMRQRFDKLTTSAHCNLIVQLQREWFLVEINKLLHHRPESLSDCAMFRLPGGGGTLYCHLGPATALVDITKPEFTDRRIWALFEMASMLICWYSDIYSCGKELARELGRRQHNICLWLHLQRGYSMDEAVAKAVVVVSRTMGLYIRLREAVAGEGNPDVCAYISTLDHYLRGGVEWIRNNNRYRYADGKSSTPVYEGGELTNELPTDRWGQVSISSVAWWWEYDPA